MSVERKSPTPYQTLNAELVSRKITYGDLAKKLGWYTSKLARKMRGERIFTLHQMIEIKNLLGVDMSVEELFRRTDDKAILPCPYAYPVLYRELQLRNITLAKLGEVIGLRQQNISAKMYGKFRFTVTEAEKAKKFLEVDMSIEELFIRADGSAPEWAHEPPPYVYPILVDELKRRGILQRELGKYLGLSQSKISQKLHGIRKFSPEQKNGDS